MFGALTDASETRQIPSLKWPRISDADSIARRVFPVPPGPVKVIKRTSFSRSSSAMRSTSSLRPINGVGCRGRLLAGTLPDDDDKLTEVVAIETGMSADFEVLSFA